MKFIISLLAIICVSLYVFVFYEKNLNVELATEIVASANKGDGFEKNAVAPVAVDKLEEITFAGSDILEDENSIADKLLFDKVNENDVEALLSDFNKDVEQGNISDELNQNMQGLFESAQQADWGGFNNAVDFLELEDVNTLSLALFQAILNNAPFTIIENLLSRGAIFLPNTAQMLALRNNVRLTKDLLPLGLDLHVVDQTGKNALSHTLISFQSREMFDFLLTNNVDVKPSPNGLDPLDMALQYSVYNAQGIYYVKQLIAHGSPIESSHIQLLAQIQELNPKNYEKIAKLLPYKN